MSFITFWLHHRSRDPRSLRAIAEFLCEPLFAEFGRTGMLDRSKRVKTEKKTLEQIFAQLTADGSRGVELDRSAKGALVATARVVFDNSTDDAPYPAPHWAYVVLPYSAERRDEYLASFCSLFTHLEGVLGFISLEPDYREAQSAALGSDTRITRERNDISEQRRRERKAQGFYLRQYPSKVPAVHWGIFVSGGHLEAVNFKSLSSSAAFFRVEKLDEKRAFLQITADPMDALSPGYEEALQAAREVLAPLLIDVSDIELTPREADWGASTDRT